jgi:daunorubicin/doxorubicin transport system ATP-binding protein
MWQTIRRLAGAGSTVLLTTQYLDEADQLADRLAVIDRGTVVAEGTPDELKASAGASTLQLRLADPGQAPPAHEAITAVLAVDAILSPESGRITAPMDEPDRVADLLVALRDRGIRLAELSVREPTLDQVFLAITGHETQPQDNRQEEAVA